MGSSSALLSIILGCSTIGICCCCFCPPMLELDRWSLQKRERTLKCLLGTRQEQTERKRRENQLRSRGFLKPSSCWAAKGQKEKREQGHQKLLFWALGLDCSPLPPPLPTGPPRAVAAAAAEWASACVCCPGSCSGSWRRSSRPS